MEKAECGKCGVWRTPSVENAECGKRGVWKMRSVENKSLNNDILNNDKFIDQTYTLIRHIQRIGLNDDGFLLGYDIEWLRPAMFCIGCDVKKNDIGRGRFQFQSVLKSSFH